VVRYVRNLDFWYYCNQRDGSDGLPSVTHFISRQGRYDIFSPSPPEVCEVRYWVGEFLKYLAVLGVDWKDQGTFGDPWAY